VAYPQRLLGDDESVVLDLHPHWTQLVLPVISLFAVAALALFAMGVLPDWQARTTVQWVILAAAVVLLFFLSFMPWLRWITTNYVVTTERVVLRTGILSRTGRDIPLQRINDVTFHHTVVERLVGSGTLTIESAGERGQVVLAKVPRVEAVQSTLYQLAEEDDMRRRHAGPDA
jgi:uncharacterized membrane protein YdbT with pleckstrin-like domain